MKKYLEEKLARFEELEKLLQDPAVLADGPRMAAVAREHGSIAKVATAYRTLKDFNRQIQEVNDLINGHDPELKELAEAELPELKAQREEVWESLIDMTAGGDDSNRTKLILEIRAGTGGDEAALFARDLYDMYTHYAENNHWKVEIMDMNATELGGFKEIVLGISGENVYQKLQYESGGHRVQRVPETEAKGRIQTSAATVAVMPEPEDVEVDLKPEDYRLDRFCSSGPGGQHVNKTSSAIRLTHYATGIVVQCQDEKSQHKNLAKALRVLKTRIYEKLHEEEEAKRSDDRKTKIGSGDRSQRIRTYNYPENRVTDHRIGLTIYKLDSIIAGNMDPIIDGLLEYERQEQRMAFGTLD